VKNRAAVTSHLFGFTRAGSIMHSYLRASTRKL
jgi:hypothetical protein